MLWDGSGVCVSDLQCAHRLMEQHATGTCLALGVSCFPGIQGSCASQKVTAEMGTDWLEKVEDAATLAQQQKKDSELRQRVQVVALQEWMARTGVCQLIAAMISRLEAAGVSRCVLLDLTNRESPEPSVYVAERGCRIEDEKASSMCLTLSENHDTVLLEFKTNGYSHGNTYETYEPGERFCYAFPANYSATESDIREWLGYFYPSFREPPSFWRKVFGFWHQGPWKRGARFCR